MNYSTDSLRKQAPRLQFQDLNRQVDKSNHQFYESNPIQMNGHSRHGASNGMMRPEETIDDLAQMLQDSTFRLSDIFSELSPSVNGQSTFNHAKMNNFNGIKSSVFNGGYHQPNGLSSNSGTLTRTNKASSNNDHYINPTIDSSNKASSSTLLRQYQLNTTTRIQSPQSQTSSSPNTQAFSSDHESNYSDNHHHLHHQHTNVNINTNTLNNRLLNKFPHPHPFLTSAVVNSSSSSFNSNTNSNNENAKMTTFVDACNLPLADEQQPSHLISF